MIQIRVLSDAVTERKGTSAASGKPYHIRMQTGYASVIAEDGSIAEIPEKFEMFLNTDEKPYPRGLYNLAPSSVYVRDGKLQISPRLAPVPAQS